MFGLIKSVAKAAVGVATLPIDIAADALTLGGAVNDKPSTYTGKKLEQVMANLSDAADSRKE